MRHALRAHPAVQAIRADLERRVLSRVLPPEAAALQILDAFAAGSAW